MTTYMMNPKKNNGDQQHLLISTKQLFKQRELLQKESICSWYTTSAFSSSSSHTTTITTTTAENDKMILDHLNILDEMDKIFDQDQDSGNKQHFPPSRPAPPSSSPRMMSHQLEETSFFSFSSSFLLEPTPLGPQGIQSQHVVDQIPLVTNSGKLLFEKNFKDPDALFLVLSPLLQQQHTEDDCNLSAKQQQQQQQQQQPQTIENYSNRSTTAYPHITGDITMTKKIPDGNITTKSTAGIFIDPSPPPADLLMPASATGENCFDTTEVFDTEPHFLERKLRNATEKVASSSKFCNPTRTATNSAIRPLLNKKQQNTKKTAFHSPSETSTTTAASSNASRNSGAAVITSDDQFSCIDQVAHHHQEEQLNYQIDSSNLALNGHTTDSSSSCSSGDGSISCSTKAVTEMPDERRFRSYQCDQWKERFQDLVDFKEKHGHCLVPYDFPLNQHLAQWIKRQRYQYKLKNLLGRHSTLTDERQAALEEIGFIWDSHKASWMEHFESLKEFKAKYGDCLVPSDYSDHSLAVWVKCQRRQHKLSLKGKKSVMTRERFLLLESLGFDWNPRNLKLPL